MRFFIVIMFCPVILCTISCIYISRKGKPHAVKYMALLLIMEISTWITYLVCMLTNGFHFISEILLLFKEIALQVLYFAFLTDKKIAHRKVCMIIATVAFIGAIIAGMIA